MRVSVANPDPVLRAVRAGARWVGAGLLVGGLAGFGVLALTPPTWTASATVETTSLVPTVDLDGSGTPAQPVTVDTDAAIIRSDGVVAAVGERADVPEPEARSSLSVTGRRLSRVVDIHFSAGSAQQAVLGADAAATAFLAERQRLVASPVLDYLAGVLQGSKDPELSSGLLPAGDDPARADVGLLEQRRERATEVQLQLASVGRVIEAARVTGVAERPDPEVYLASGAALGGLLGVGLRGLRAWRRGEAL